MFAFPFLLKAQDIHWTQFNNAPLHINPALTGVYNGDIRFAGNLRRQWFTVPVSYATFSGAFDTKIYNKQLEKSQFAVGMLFSHDQAGDGRLRMAQLGLSGSFLQQIGNGHYLSLGGMLGGAQRTYDSNNLNFDDQFNGKTFDPGLTTQEPLLRYDDNILFGDLSGGVNYHYKATEKRTRLDVGLGAFHLNRPDRSFREESKAPCPIRYSIYGMGQLPVSNNLDLVLQAVGQYQGPHREAVIGAGINIHLNQNLDKEFSIQPGAYYRFNEDAFSPYIGARYRMWNFGFSYDVNTSGFTRATNQVGGPEFSISHIITTVKPLRTRICPIYL